MENRDSFFRKRRTDEKTRRSSFEHVLEILFESADRSAGTYRAKAPASKTFSFASFETLRSDKELAVLAAKVDAEWVAKRCRGIDRLYSRMRRNINRQLGLDALGVSLSTQ